MGSVLQWGRRNYPAETLMPAASSAASLTASMGPPELPGGNDDPSRPPKLRVAEASMGPPELPGGNNASGRPRPPPATCFNGAAGITRRKLTPQRRNKNRNKQLQWGRRNYPAETVGVRNTEPEGSEASMGPPKLPGGNVTVRELAGGLRVALQWGRRNYPAETPAQRAGAADCYLCFNGAAGITRRKPCWSSWRVRMVKPLQWGRRNYPAETKAAYLKVLRRRLRLQWGRRNYPAETPLGAGVVVVQPDASMGPPELPGGNADG